MKIFFRLIIVAMIMAFAAPAYAAQAYQIFACEVDDEVTEEMLETRASAWLAAAKTIKGGENLRAFVHHPVAAKMNEGDMMFVIVAPTIAEWGTFWDNYKNSAADKLDQKNSDVACPDSFLFEAVEVK
ncbi:MAG: hypothetical protein WBN88_04525 [Anderseniella sp.]